jgi:hypothetical protein
MDKLTHFKPSLVTKHFFPYEVNWPAEINHGRCFQWSYYAFCMFDGVTLCDTDLNRSVDSHAFVKYHDRYYDSETLQGVYDFTQMPAVTYTSQKLVIHTPESFKDLWVSQTYRFCISWETMEEFVQVVLRSIANDS